MRAICLKPMESPSVAITSGITPWRANGSTTARLKPAPSTSIDSGSVARNAQPSGRPVFRKNSIENAGSITISPSAKLMVPEACHSSVNPSAASA